MLSSGLSGVVDCAFLGVVGVGELDSSVRSMTLGDMTVRFEGTLKKMEMGFQQFKTLMTRY